MPSSSGAMRLRPMTLGDIIDETIRLYRGHFLSFVTAMGIYAVGQAIFSIATSFLGGSFEGGRTPSVSQIVTLVSIAIPGGLLVALGSFWSYGAVIKLASDAIMGRPLDVGDAYRAAFGRTLSMIWATILIGIVVGLVAVTIIGIPYAVYLGLGWSLTYQAILLEQLGGRAAMRRSSTLVRGYRWRLLGISLLIGILVSILASIPSMIVAGAAGASIAMSGARGAATPLIQVVNALVGAGSQALFGALQWITFTILYYELRVRKEAFDLEQRAVAGEPRVSLPPA